MARLMTNLYDVSKCTACRGCVIACKDTNQLSVNEIGKFKGSYQTIEDLNGNTYTIMRFNEHDDPVDGVRWNFLKWQCMHCIDPVCVKVCPKKALSKLEWGATIQDPDKCIGCQYCSYACPFGVPKYRKTTDTITKCTLCYERVAEGLKPACTRTCPSGALTFGYRDELLVVAEERARYLRANGFPRATVYGKVELGTGTNKLYVLTDTPDKFDLPVDPQISTSTWVWQDWVQPYAGWLIPIALAGSTISFVTTRLMANKNGDHQEGGHE